MAGKSREDLCALLTPDQQAALGVKPPNSNTDVGGKPGEKDYPNCGWLTPAGAEPSYSVAVYAVPQAMAEWVDSNGPAFPETEASYTVAGGFSAKQAQGGAGLEQLGCSGSVDVAQGPTLDVFFSPTLTGTMSNQQICDKAKQAAEAAVTTLQSQG